MGEKEETKVVIEISPTSTTKSKETGSEEEEEGSPLRPVFCLKRNIDMKQFDEIEDCFILDFDPFDDTFHQVTNLSVFSSSSHCDDLSIIAEKGQVACRDYPHSRHLCIIYPFDTTPHESYCELCYCYVCDLAAPCKYWTCSISGHCHASDFSADWKAQRNLRKKQLPLHN